MINERRIQYLLTVAEERNITSASKKLYISQPALSRLILNLEHELGTELFIRDRGNLHLTQAGEVYLRGCRAVLAISNSVAKEISDLDGSKTGRITLGVTSLTGEFLLPAILDFFEKKYPGVELVLAEERMSVLQEMVKKGDIDLAFVYETQDKELDYRLALQDTIYLQVPNFYFEKQIGWHSGIGNLPLPPKALSGQPMVLLKKGRGMRIIADQFMLQFGISPGKLIETENIHLANSLVCLNKGFTFVPGMAVHQFDKCGKSGTYCEVQGYPMYRKLYCCYRKGRYLTEAERYLMDLIPKLI